jgi:hypothetical protein
MSQSSELPSIRDQAGTDYVLLMRDGASMFLRQQAGTRVLILTATSAVVV